MASTNSKEAFDAFEALPNPLVRVNALNPHYAYAPEDGLVVGLGSTAPTAAAIIKMVEGSRQFEFIGVDGAPVVTVDSQEMSAFNEAARKLPELARYPQYYIGNVVWNQIPEGNKLLVHAGDGVRVEIPSGQWYTMQELKILVDGGREADVSFKFHGGDTVATRLFEKNQSLTLIYDPRGPAQLTSGLRQKIPAGSVLGGSVSPGAFPAQTNDFDN
ncbi:MAG: hypothetical protein IT559_03210 [Alphaproteobacteria bacterium]|nr:hypothetical protein [Alphaproteobacteria bacterium]